MATPRKATNGVPNPDWDGTPARAVSKTYKRLPEVEVTEGQRLAALRGLTRRGALDLVEALGLEDLVTT